MFDISGSHSEQRSAADAGVPVTAAAVAAWSAALMGVAREATDVERVDLLRALEVLRCAAAGAQAVVAADFDASQRAVQAAAGVRAERQGRGVAAQVALARRESPNTGQKHLGLAKVLTTEMPHTLHALRTGRITGGPPSWSARPPACPWRTVGPWTGRWPVTPMRWRPTARVS